MVLSCQKSGAKCPTLSTKLHHSLSELCCLKPSSASTPEFISSCCPAAWCLPPYSNASLSAVLKFTAFYSMCSQPSFKQSQLLFKTVLIFQSRDTFTCQIWSKDSIQCTSYVWRGKERILFFSRFHCSGRQEGKWCYSAENNSHLEGFLQNLFKRYSANWILGWIVNVLCVWNCQFETEEVLKHP